MTVHPPRARAVRRTLRARAAVTFGAVVIALLPLVGAMPADATTVSPTPTPSPAVPVGTTQFTLSPVGSGIVQPGDRLSVSVTLQNSTAAATPPVTVTLSLGAAPLRDRAALTAWLNGDGSGARTEQVGATTIDSVPVGGEQVEGIGIEATDPVLVGRAPGVYPLVAEYQGPDGAVTSTSAMIVPDPEATPVGLGVVVPITAGALADGLLTTAALAELTAPTGSLTNQLNAIEGTSVILAVDPAIPAAIRGAGNVGAHFGGRMAGAIRRASAVAIRTAVRRRRCRRAAQGRTVATTPADVALACRSAGDFIPVPAPTSEPEPTPAPTPTPEVDPDAPVYPDLPALFDTGGGRPGVYWPAAGAAGPDTVATLGGITVRVRPRSRSYRR